MCSFHEVVISTWFHIVIQSSVISSLGILTLKASDLSVQSQIKLPPLLLDLVSPANSPFSGFGTLKAVLSSLHQKCSLNPKPGLTIPCIAFQFESLIWFLPPWEIFTVTSSHLLYGHTSNKIFFQASIRNNQTSFWVYGLYHTLVSLPV